MLITKGHNKKISFFEKLSSFFYPFSINNQQKNNNRDFFPSSEEGEN
jgi:hypothetical protein